MPRITAASLCSPLVDESRGPQLAQATTEALASALAPVFDLRKRYESLLGPLRLGSTAEADNHHPLGELVWVQALQLWVVAADHAIAWHDLLTRAGLQPFRAHGTLLRGCLESAVVCRWLVDPSADQNTRLGRAVGLQLDDFVERGKFEAATGSADREPVGSAARAKERVAELRKDAEDAGVKPIKPMGYVDLFDRYSVGGWLYRLLSAFAHGKQWALLASDRSRLRSVGGFIQGQVTASDDVSIAATRFGMDALEAGLADLERYYVSTGT